MTNDQESLKALSKAKISLMGNNKAVFFSHVCLALNHEFTEDLQTAATDGLMIKYNPKFFMDLTPQERVGLVLHETLHVAFDHVGRLKDKDEKRWNVAADYAINLVILDAGFELPKGGLVNYKYRDWSTEKIYADLEDLTQEEEKSMDDLGEAKGDPIENKHELDNILVAAQMQAKNYGIDVPGEIETYLEELTNPKIPWNKILRRYLTQSSKVTQDFKRPKRRYMPDVILPTSGGHTVSSGLVAVDISSSVTQEEYRQFVTETAGIFKKLKPPKIEVVQFNHRIVSVDTVKSFNDVKKLTLQAQGGTNITPVIKHINKTRDVKWALIFSDGEFYSPQVKSKLPVIWVIYNNPNFKAPYGKVIHYNI